MMNPAARVPVRAWVVTLAGLVVNLCLGILYAWSVWKQNLLTPAGVEPGASMSGLNVGWHFLTDSQATTAYSICGFVFALAMIPGGRLQDRFGPRFGATIAGVCLASGCILAGLMKSYLGLILGFGLLGGIGMGFGYAAATPAAVRWFGPQRRGLIVGIVVAGYGAAAVYIAPLAKYLIVQYGISGSFIVLGVLFAAIVLLAARFLVMPPIGYQPYVPATSVSTKATNLQRDFSASEVLRTWQYYALVGVFIGGAQSGLLVIANAVPVLNLTASATPILAANAWVLAAFGGIVNATGRVGTGSYSDTIGRANAFTVNGLLAAVCLLLAPHVIAAANPWLLFLLIGIVYWQYGGTLALMPAFTADFYGSKNLGMNYGLVFLGWGIAFLVPQLAGVIKDETGRLDLAFYLSALLVIIAIVLCRCLRKPS